MKFKWVIIVFLPAVMVIFSMTISLYFAQNIPLLDDYNFCLQYLSDLEELDHWIPRLKSLFIFQNGHPIVTQKLLFLLDYKIFNQVDFRHFVVLNNLFHFSILVALYKIIRLRSDSPLLALPLALLLMVPVFTLNNWPSCFMHFATISAALYSFYFLALSGFKNFIYGLSFAAISSISSGAGILVFFSAIPLILSGYQRRERIIWILATVLFSLYYFVNYWMVQDPTGSNQTGWIIYLINFVVFFGSVFKSIYGDHHLWGGLLGLAILLSIMMVTWTFKSRWRDNPILISGLLFSILVAFVTSMMRSQYGMGATTAYRYRFYQMMPLIFMLIALLWFRKDTFRNNLPGLIFVMILMYGFRIENTLGELKLRKDQLQLGARLWQNTGNPSGLTFRNQSLASQILKEASNKAIYQLEADIPMETKESGFTGTLPGMYSIFAEKVFTDNYIYLQGRALPNTTTIEQGQIRIGFGQQNKLYHYPTSPIVGANDLLPQRSDQFRFFLNISDTHPKDPEYYLILYHWLHGIMAMERIVPDE